MAEEEEEEEGGGVRTDHSQRDHGLRGRWGRRERVDVMVSQGDENMLPCATDLSVQYRVQYGVIALHILWE